jgi:DNA invertase Pin-like site-specific DNA recombinase
MERIVGYARESTMDQAHNGFNMDDQERRIREFCEFEHGDVPYQLTISREEGCSGELYAVKISLQNGHLAIKKDAAKVLQFEISSAII